MDTPQFLCDLPIEFEPLRIFLEASLKPYIKIVEKQVGRVNDDSSGDPLTLWQSKIGGNPYFPKDFAYPIDPVTGEAMVLLIQINCADVPQIEGFDFPQHGILQSYIGGIQYADAYVNDDRFCMLYFPEISEDLNDLITDFSFINPRKTIRGDIDEICKLDFSAEHNLFWESRYTKDLISPEELTPLCEEFGEWLYEYYYENNTDKLGSKIGGHPDLHATINEMEEAAKGRLLLELTPFYGDDYLFWFIRPLAKVL